MDRTLKKVLITDPIDAKCIEILQEANIQVEYKPKLPVQEILDQIKDADGLIVRSGTTVTANIINAAKQLKIIGRAGVGVDNIDCPAATHNGVVVINAPGGNTISAAEHTCALIVSMTRYVPQGCASLKEGKWDRAKYMGNELYGKTLAIVGLGRIGREVASRMQSFGMKTIGFDPLVSAEESKTFDVEWLSLEEIWPKADFVTLHVPLIPQTKNLIDRTVLAKCRKGVRFVNVARGGIIDEEAIYESLEAGHCGGLGVDVFMEEPPKNLTLIKHPKVVCTPHLGASTYEAQVKVATEISEQFVAFVQGKPLHGTVNAPSLNEAMKAERRSLVTLAQALGKLSSSFVSSSDSKQQFDVTVHKHGDSLKNDGNLVLTAALVGMLEKKASTGINLVNAPALASAAGIVTATKTSSESQFGTPSVGIEVVNNGESHVVVGGTAGDLPLLYAIDSAKFPGGLPLRGNLLMFKGAASEKSLTPLIDAISQLNIPIVSAGESTAVVGEPKWYFVAVTQPLDSVDKLRMPFATFVAQFNV